MSSKKPKKQDSRKAAPSSSKLRLGLLALAGAVALAAAGSCVWRMQSERRDADAAEAALSVTPPGAESGAPPPAGSAHSDVGQALPAFVACMVGGPVPIRNGTELMKKLAQGSSARSVPGVSSVLNDLVVED